MNKDFGILLYVILGLSTRKIFSKIRFNQTVKGSKSVIKRRPENEVQERTTIIIRKTKVHRRITLVDSVFVGGMKKLRVKV